MKDEILSCISKRSRYSYKDVEASFKDLHSYDHLLVAMNIALTQNLSLAYATSMIMESKMSKAERQAAFEKLDELAKHAALY